uniref:MYG1 exonuclease n=1 Tax=Sinocyclocheilus anshuiensis TaxID=1608454 RepID=A0A671RJ66_9TELE
MKMRIGTHNGTFHCDDVLVCFLLRQLPEYKVRDRNQTSSQTQTYRNKSSTCLDVRMESESLCPEKRWVTKLSSACSGAARFSLKALSSTQTVSDSSLLQMYESSVEEVDDGISQCDGEVQYCLNMKTFQSQEGFQKALALVGAEFKDRLHYYMKAWLPAREFVQQVVQSRYQCCDWCRVLWIPAGSCCCCPWKEHLFVLEKQLKLDVLIKFVLYPDPSGHWRVQCVPAGLNSFQNRCEMLSDRHHPRTASILFFKSILVM